jgi:hypothetical protein
MDRYVVETRIKSLSFMDGYSCESESPDHFLRHLGHRFSKCCDMSHLNNVYKTNGIIIKRVKSNKNDILKKVELEKKPNIINEYWGKHGYILEINIGTINNPMIEVREFVSDTEAYEWINAQ